MAAITRCLMATNKRAAWMSLVMFVDLNGYVWDPDPPDTEDADAAV